jgi:ribonuclease BN (tRNA processing enzyme)
MIRIVILGSGSIIPARNRFASSIYLDTGSHKILIDCGPGTIEKMRHAGINPWLIDAVLLTHFHIDHSSDLLPFLKLRAYDEDGRMAANPTTIRIYGPRGLANFLEQTIDHNKYYNYLSEVIGYHNYTEICEMAENEAKYHDGLKIISRRARHSSGIMYRLEVENKVLVFSGDTAFDPNIVEAAKNADLLIHECSFPRDCLVGEHTSEDDLSQIVSLVKPRILVITHLYPAWNGREAELVRKVAEKFRCRIYIAHDMLEIRL